jgi:hypothetical protein
LPRRPLLLLLRRRLLLRRPLLLLLRRRLLLRRPLLLLLRRRLLLRQPRGRAERGQEGRAERERGIAPRAAACFWLLAAGCPARERVSA